MRRVSFPLLTVFLAAGVAAIAQMPNPGQPTNPAARVLRGEDRLTYLGKRLGLAPAQKQQFDSLLEVYRVTVADERSRTADILHQIRSLLTDLQEAQKAGDTAKADAIRDQIGMLRPGVKAEKEFLTNLTPMLDPGQIELLEMLKQRLDRNRATELASPLEILAAARALQPTEQQTKDLDKLQEDLRQKMASQTDVNREAVLEQFTRDVRKVLTGDQVAKFDRVVEALKPEPVNPASAENTPTPVNITPPGAAHPATQPGAKPATP
ncbi:MAG: hypothetical protein AB7Q17_10470 [Phycisphaerae bacterium]